MPIHQRAREAAIFSPPEVALLGRVFDKLKTNISPQTNVKPSRLAT